MAKNIILIGFMGTGKSTVGIRLAQKMKREFIDMDRKIEEICGMSVAEIFKRYGEVRFRSEESLLAAKLGEKQDLIISTGGGAVLFAENVAALRKNGILICLDADPADIFSRVNRKKGSRPLLKKNMTVEDIENLLKQREPYYDLADIRISTSGKDLERVVREIMEIVQSRNLLAV